MHYNLKSDKSYNFFKKSFVSHGTFSDRVVLPMIMAEQDPTYIRISHLIRLAIKEELSPAEQAELDNWLSTDPDHHALYNELLDEATRHEALRQISKYDDKAALGKLMSQIDQSEDQPGIGRRSWWYAAAASAIIMVSVGGYFLSRHSKVDNGQQLVSTNKQDVLPGQNRATLTLANGQKIILTKGLTGQLAQQGNTRIAISGNNAVAYTNDLQNAEEPVTYNTLSTTRKEMSPYPLVLADGTKVWLNAESSLTFPTAFRGKDRVVKLVGQAYFEVVHNAAQPFKVETGSQTIEDIGTSFDVMAYADEPVKRTTLITGSIRLTDQGRTALLKPGQAALVGPDHIKVTAADTDDALAWKNGQFMFDNEDLGPAMRKIARWYDVDIVYPQGQILHERYWGSANRYGNVSQVLAMLEKIGDVKFKVDGRRIILSKK